jgi:YggT family protein
MSNLLGLGVWLIHNVLSLLSFVIIAWVIMSWLVGFDVINLRNRFAHSIYRALDAATGWMFRPLRRLIPPIGGTLDITPLIPLLLIEGIQMWVTGPYLVMHPPGLG